MELLKINILSIIIISSSLFASAQDTTKSNEPLNAVNTIVVSDREQRLTIGAYGQLEYTQQILDSLRHTALLDIHRIVMFMGYKFNSRTHFISEFEFEHVNEPAVEQAFVNYRINHWADFRAGLMLIPMGIINEYHEPTTFNGSLRPNLDGKIVPSTWREMGAGFQGKFDRISLKYQIYLVNGFNGFDASGGKFRGIDGLRGGRQKAIKSYMSSPDLSAKIDYFGIPGLKFGAAVYTGQSESILKDGLWINDSTTASQAMYDSSRVNIMMLGADVRYEWKGFNARAQYILANLGNTAAYNKFTGKDLGSSMTGYYVEAGFNILQLWNIAENQLVVFGRYENYNTHSTVEEGTIKNEAFNRTDLTVGIGYFIKRGVAFKADYLNMTNAKSGSRSKQYLNMGIGFWF